LQRLRHYFVSDNMDDLETFEEQLEAAGIATPQIHVLTLNDAEAENHEHIHDVTSLMKTDLVHSWEIGALIGVAVAAIILVVAYFSGWTETVVGWMPFIFLSIVALGFCTWEGGLLGIQKPNHNFERFQSALKDGKHVLFMDLDTGQESILANLISKHPQVEKAGTGSSTMPFIVYFETKLPGILKQTLP